MIGHGIHGINSTVEIARDIFRIRGSAGRIWHLANLKSYMSYLQQYTSIIKMPTLKTYYVSPSNEGRHIVLV